MFGIDWPIVTLSHRKKFIQRLNHRGNTLIKLRPMGAQTCALPLFCDRDINPINLKLEGD